MQTYEEIELRTFLKVNDEIQFRPNQILKLREKCECSILKPVLEAELEELLSTDLIKQYPEEVRTDTALGIMRARYFRA